MSVPFEAVERHASSCPGCASHWRSVTIDAPFPFPTQHLEGVRSESVFKDSAPVSCADGLCSVGAQLWRRYLEG